VIHCFNPVHQKQRQQTRKSGGMQDIQHAKSNYDGGSRGWIYKSKDSS
jgi:hypothetical protein